MVFFTQGELERQIANYNDKFNLDLDGKSIKECIEIIMEVCPQLHSDEYLKELARSNLKSIEKTYGFKALRLFMYETVKQCALKSFQREDLLERKYRKLIKEVREYHESNIKLKLILDIYRYYIFLEEMFDEEYGSIDYYNNRLYSILKTLDICYYNGEVVNSLHNFLYNELCFSGDKYYIKKDLKNPDVLKMLYEHVAEENGDETVVQSYNIYTEYDGYGNEYYISDYEESWTDEDGTYHCRTWAKPSTIEDYVKLGLPND